MRDGREWREAGESPQARRRRGRKVESRVERQRAGRKVRATTRAGGVASGGRSAQREPAAAGLTHAASKE